MKKLKGYRTIIMNVIMTISTVLMIWAGKYSDESLQFIKDNSEEILTSIAAIWGLLGTWLRIATDTPVFKNGN